MKKNIFLAAIICSFIFLLGVSFVLAGPPSIQYNKEEGADDVTEYASDSGSFALLDGYEFTNVYVHAFVEDGQGGNSPDMTAVAHIQISSEGFHSAAEANEDDDGGEDYDNLTGDGYGGSSWYWSVDTRNNIGDGTAWCKWAWHQVD